MTRTACRAPGVIPAAHATEIFMDHVAAALALDPAVVRRMNLVQQGQVTPYGQPLPYCSIGTMWDDFVAANKYTEQQQVRQFGCGVGG
jgi:xanthine dehydrogenase molybdopterin-binding subunit B